MIYAEDINYWKTGRSAPDAWLKKAKAQIVKLGGTVLAEGFGNDVGSGQAAYMLGFEIEGQRFKVLWPVLPSRSGEERSARIQAATLLYHDVKARCISATVLGARVAFFNYLVLPNGRTAAEMTGPHLLNVLERISRPVLPPLEDELE
jgi:hypothetical protein